jgi:hypothetical protein
MTRPDADLSLFAECLAAMAASGEAYPCDTFAPIRRADSVSHDGGPQTTMGLPPRRLERL